MEFFLVLIIAFFLLAPEDIQQLSQWLGKFWRTKNEWQARAHRWLNSLKEP